VNEHCRLFLLCEYIPEIYSEIQRNMEKFSDVRHHFGSVVRGTSFDIVPQHD